MTFLPPRRLAVLLALCTPAAALAQDAEPRREQAQLSPLSVIGSAEAVEALPGSGAYLDREDLTRQGYDDVGRVLREIPGVYVREEDGYGLFPNISLRGADPGRSSKVTIMEDGILSAPAPYSDPAAYYSPTIGRMSALEVLKGSSQIQYGPHTTGGVLNFLSTPIPLGQQGYFRTAYGSDNEFRNHGYVGETVTTASGQFGYLVELFHRQTDGFKEIDIPGRVGPNQGESGFRKIEPMIKLSWQPDTEVLQRFEIKYGRTNQTADETYLGLSREDFAANPYRRYAGSRFDNIETEHERSYLRHYIAFSDDTELTSTAYYNRFHRNWFKIFGAGVDRINDQGETVNANVPLGVALADPNARDALEVLRGERAGRLRYRNNNREYGLQGLESILKQRFSFGDTAHTLTAGARLHEDYILRFQNDETFTQDGTGRVTGSTIGAPGSQDNRRIETRALSLFVEDRIEFGRLAVTPGLRYEDLDWTLDDRRPGRGRSTGSESYVTGGLGLNYALSQGSSLFGGVYQGFSPPSPSGGIDGSEEEEKSLSLELGYRGRSAGGLQQEIVAFATAFDNLLVLNNAGGAGAGQGQPESVGEVNLLGLEMALGYDGGQWLGGGYRLPMRLSVTYTDAEIANDVTGTGAGGEVESIFSGARKGAELPYIPEWQASLSAGLERGIWSLALAAQYVDRSFATALNTEDTLVLAGADTLVQDARGGVIPSFVTVDLTGSLQMSPRTRLFANVFNLLDREYEVSRLPEGPRPGAPITVLVGAEFSLF